MSLIFELDEPTLSEAEIKKTKIDPKSNDGLFYKFLEYKGISFRSVSFLEVLFRQLMMAKQFKTGIDYNDEKKLEAFCGKMDARERVRKIENHISFFSKQANQYGFNRLSIDKKEQLRKIDIQLKKAVADIRVLKARAAELAKNDDDLFDLESEIENLHKNLIKRKNNELSDGVYRGKGFVYINANSELVIDVQKFHYLKFYAVIYHSLAEPFFSSMLEMGDSETDKSEHEKMGLKGFIARKLCFEFQNRLGFKPTADFISKLIKNSKTLNHIPGEIDKMKIVDRAFFEYLK